MFHLSFLIRDGECAMEIEDGEPVICGFSFFCHTCKLSLTTVALNRYLRATIKRWLRTGLEETTIGAWVWYGNVGGRCSCHSSCTVGLITVKAAIRTFNITEPMIPQRPKAQKAAGNKWYGWRGQCASLTPWSLVAPPFQDLFPPLIHFTEAVHYLVRYTALYHTIGTRRRYWACNALRFLQLQLGSRCGHEHDVALRSIHQSYGIWWRQLSSPFERSIPWPLTLGDLRTLASLTIIEIDVLFTLVNRLAPPRCHKAL